MDTPQKSMVVRLTPDQTEQLMAWAGEITEAHVNADCEPPGYRLVVEVWAGGPEATAHSGGDVLELGDVAIEFLPS